MRRSIRRFIIPHGNLPGIRTYADLSVQISPVEGGGGEGGMCPNAPPKFRIGLSIFFAKRKISVRDILLID